MMLAGYWHSPVHEVHVHLVVVSVLLHLNRVRQDHVKVENQILDLEKESWLSRIFIHHLLPDKLLWYIFLYADVLELVRKWARLTTTADVVKSGSNQLMMLPSGRIEVWACPQATSSESSAEIILLNYTN